MQQKLQNECCSFCSFDKESSSIDFGRPLKTWQLNKFARARRSCLQFARVAASAGHGLRGSSGIGGGLCTMCLQLVQGEGQSHHLFSFLSFWFDESIVPGWRSVTRSVCRCCFVVIYLDTPLTHIHRYTNTQTSTGGHH